MAYIKKEPIIEFIQNGLNNPDKDKAFGHDAIEILTEVEFATEADVAEVVRCGECKWYKYGNCKHFFGLRGLVSKNKHFCCYGKRKFN